MIPFTVDQFLAIFAQYNLAVWPAQLLLYGVALCAVGLAVQHRFDGSGTISLILAGLWGWSGVVYHFIFFSSINKAGYLFAALFIAQAIFLFYLGVLQRKLRFCFSWNLSGLVGVVLILYALVIYPILNYQFHHGYPTMPTFGVPCPTTIFTFGILTWANGEHRPFVFVIPVLWSLVGFSAALSLGMIEDFGLVGAAVFGLLCLFTERVIARQQKRSTKQHEKRIQVRA